MIPVYKTGVRYVTGSLIRTKNREKIFYIISSIIICFIIIGLYLSTRLILGDPTIVRSNLGDKTSGLTEDSQAQDTSLINNNNVDTSENNKNKLESPLLKGNDTKNQNIFNDVSYIEVDQADDSLKLKDGSKESHTSGLINVFFPLFAGFLFGFMGSIPVAGPTSAVVLKFGIQGKYQEGHAVALGGATSEAIYAGIAYWGFGNFLAKLNFLFPLCKVLGALVLLIVGTVFLLMDIRPQMDQAGAKKTNSSSSTKNEIIKNLMLGLTISGINPALIATYTGAIATIYGTGLLEFNFFLALVFSLGVCSGVSSWFFILLNLLKKYKKRIKEKTLAKFIKAIGFVLFVFGLIGVKASINYLWG